MNKRVEDKYEYVSFSRLNFSHTLDDLIDSADNWEPIESRVLHGFDITQVYSEIEKANAKQEYFLDDFGAKSTSEKILYILGHDHYRAGNLEFFDKAKPMIKDKIESCISNEKPISIIIPSFPGREINPLARTRPQIHLGEMAAICRLADICKAIERVYTPGAEITIVSDGTAYGSFYGISAAKGTEYKRMLIKTIESLGCKKYVKVDDLAEIIETRRVEFEELYQEAEREVSHTWEDSGYEFKEELAYTMRMGTYGAAINAAAMQLVKFPDSNRSDAEVLKKLRNAVEKQARNTAYIYQCLLVALRKMNLLDRHYPDAIRGTVHAKEGQYSPHLVNRYSVISPWHGIAVKKKNGRIDTAYEATIIANRKNYVAVYLEGEVHPFYYEEKC